MGEEPRFVRFISARYHALRGLQAVALGVAGLFAAPLLPRDWTEATAIRAGLIGAGLAAAALLIARYYDRHLGRARPTVKEKRHPWFAAAALFALESVGRRLALRGAEAGVLAIGLATALGFQAIRDWRFRKHAMLVPLVLAGLGVDRLTRHSATDPWTWLEGAVAIVAAALIVQGLADHVFISQALNPTNRRLAASALPVASGAGRWASAAGDPAAATILTALDACEDADVMFLGNVAGLHPGEAAARVEALRDAGLVHLEEQGRGSQRLPFARLTIRGRDLVPHLWLAPVP
jgi:DNA-binding transcriptional ArsR family regulator